MTLLVGVGIHMLLKASCVGTVNKLLCISINGITDMYVEIAEYY